MRNSFTIAIPNPCSQKWSEMITATKGRFCNSCEKEIIDFSRKTDTDIVRFLNSKTDQVCGRFHPSQLNRELIPAVSESGPTSLAALVALAITLTASPAYSQTDSTQHASVLVPSTTSDSSKFTTKRIEGNLIDSSGVPVVGVLVQLWNDKASISSAYTDLDGKFALEIYGDYPYVTVVINDVQVELKRIPFTKKSDQSLLKDVVVKLLYREVDFDSEYFGTIGIVYPSKKQIRKSRRVYRRDRREERRANRSN